MVKKFTFLVAKNLSIALLGIFVLTSCLYSFDVDSYDQYENEDLIKKHLVFREYVKDYNTLFIGSSRIYEHLNSTYFDSLTGITKSYNLAYLGLFPYRSFDCLDRALQESNHIENIFIELHPPNIYGSSYNSSPALQSIDYERWLITLNLAAAPEFPLRDRFLFAVDYSRQFLYKYLGFSSSKYIKLLLGIGSSNDINGQDDIKYDKFHGYYGLDPENETGLAKYRREQFLKNSSGILEEYKNNYFQQDLTKYEPYAYTNYVKSYAEELSRRYSVYFVIPPRHDVEDYLFFNNFKNHLGDFPILDLTSPELYPEFYDVEFSFDRLHLDLEGSRLFTYHLAQFFLEKIPES